MSAAREERTIATVGEFALIDLLADALAGVGAATAPDLLGIGDDAAIWTPTPGTRALITTDSLIAGIHFRLDWTSWRDLGHKALAVNLSDIAAMGARPRLATISLALTGAEPLAGLLDLYRGLGTLAAQHGVAIAGGDIVASPERLGLHITVVGESWPEAAGRLLTRDAARPGDLLATSGPLGLSAAGLAILLESKVERRKSKDDPPATQYLSADLTSPSDATTDRRPPTTDFSPDSRLTTLNYLSAHHRPTPQIAYGRALVAAGVRVAMDLSDGLFGDLAKICARSGVAACIQEAALPVPPALREQFPARWLQFATRGGEDYELLFAAPSACAPAASRRACPPPRLSARASPPRRARRRSRCAAPTGPTSRLAAARSIISRAARESRTDSRGSRGDREPSGAQRSWSGIMPQTDPLSTFDLRLSTLRCRSSRRGSG
jgi:thiamine-monophosphate kinase